MASAGSSRWTGFVIALLAGTLFGVGGTFGQFLFQHRGVDLDWLVTARLLVSGSALLLLSAARDGRLLLAPWRDRRDSIQLLLFGIFGMLAVQYTYFAAIHASNTATATVLQYTGPAMIAVWLAQGITHHRLGHGDRGRCAQLPAPALGHRG